MVRRYYTDNDVVSFFVERRAIWRKLLRMEAMTTWDSRMRSKSMMLVTIRLQDYIIQMQIP